MFSWLSFRDVANLVPGWLDIGMACRFKFHVTPHEIDLKYYYSGH